jgi:hypothetical protein
MQCINLASLEIVKARPAKFAHLFATEEITTEADEPEYELTTTDVVAVRFCSATWQGRLKRKDDDYAARISSSGPNPWAWYPAGGSNDGVWVIGLIGMPSRTGKTVTAHLTIVPATIVYNPDVPETTTTSVLPQTYDLPIVAKAIKIGLMLGGRRSDAGKQAPLDGETEARARRSDPGAIEHKWPIGGSLPDVGVKN